VNSVERLGIPSGDQTKLLHALDFWWLYLVYAGFPKAPVWAAMGVLKLAGLYAAWRAWRAARAEAIA
jgi:hypothetical protein